MRARSNILSVVLPFCLVLLCGFAFVFWQYVRIHSDSVRTTVVRLTDRGFEPARIEVESGQMVVFVNESSRKFWPASDLHPTHSIYPEFDAHAPVEPGGRWSFTFSKDGTWRYHDHLSPSVRGVVVVHLGMDGVVPPVASCSAVSAATAKESCWNEAVIAFLDKQGVTAALGYVGNLYKTEPLFAADCHDYLHKVGEAVYDRHMELAGLLGPETSYCGYGFFHGYMERLLAVSGDITEAAKFCDAISRQATDTVRDACFHGFGHGLFASAAEKATRAANAEEMVAQALVGCERMGGSQTQRAARCSSGVFMELGVDEGAALYNLRIDTQEPLGICKKQPAAYVADCYRQMQVVVMNLAAGNILKGAKYSEQLEDPNLAATSIETYMGGATRLDTEGIAAALDACRHVQTRLEQPCIHGIALAYMLRGAPGAEAEAAVSFCNTHGLSTSEAGSCRQYVVRYARSAYAAAVLARVCAMLPDSEQAQCK